MKLQWFSVLQRCCLVDLAFLFSQVENSQSFLACFPFFSTDLTRLLWVSNSPVHFKSLSSFSSISARRAFVDLHFGQPWLSSSKTSSSVCELPSRVRFIFLL